MKITLLYYLNLTYSSIDTTQNSSSVCELLAITRSKLNSKVKTSVNYNGKKSWFYLLPSHFRVDKIFYKNGLKAGYIFAIDTGRIF